MVVNVARVDGEVKVLSSNLTRLDLLTCDALARKAEHLLKITSSRAYFR
jgi:hypothetical protein